MWRNGAHFSLNCETFVGLLKVIYHAQLFLSHWRCICFFASGQTTTTYTSATTWTVPANVYSISVKAYGAGGGQGGQDCGAGCTNASAGNAGFVDASFVVVPGNVVGIYPGAKGVNGLNSATASGGGAGGGASYSAAYNGGKGGNAGPSGSSGGGGGGGAATLLTISVAIKLVAGGAGGGGGMANLAMSGLAGTNSYLANGTLFNGGVGTAPPGDGGGGGGGGGGNYGSLGGTTHAAGSEQAGNGGNLGGNLVSGATTTTSNTNITWTTGGRIDITYTVTLPVTWVSFTTTPQINGTVLLKWRTASELNTRSYFVQRSVYGNDWTTIGTEPAVGNSNSSTDYQFSDRSVSGNTLYYRLAQVDVDGQVHFSKTVICTVGNSAIILYPNPVHKGAVTLSLTDAAIVVIYDQSGRVLFTKSLPAGTSRIDLSHYAVGVYFLQAGEKKIPFQVK